MLWRCQTRGLSLTQGRLVCKELSPGTGDLSREVISAVDEL